MFITSQKIKLLNYINSEKAGKIITNQIVQFEFFSSSSKIIEQHMKMFTIWSNWNLPSLNFLNNHLLIFEARVPHVIKKEIYWD